MKTLTIFSSNGTFVANASTGEHLADQSTFFDPSEPSSQHYRNITRFDVRERCRFWARQQFPCWHYFTADILDLGYWYKIADGSEIYEFPSADWRNDLVNAPDAAWRKDMDRTPPRNVRFWEPLNHGFVRVSLAPGQSRTWAKSERTEEGYLWVGCTWEYQTCKGEPVGVQREWGNGGRDCDGPISTTGVDFCTLEKLDARLVEQDHPAPFVSTENATYYRPPIGAMRVPEWGVVCAPRVTDVYAQQMGY